MSQAWERLHHENVTSSVNITLIESHKELQQLLFLGIIEKLGIDLTRTLTTCTLGNPIDRSQFIPRFLGSSKISGNVYLFLENAREILLDLKNLSFNRLAKTFKKFSPHVFGRIVVEHTPSDVGMERIEQPRGHHIVASLPDWD